MRRTLLFAALTLLACRTDPAAPAPVAPRAARARRPSPVVALEGRKITVDGAVVGSIDGKSTLDLLPALDDLGLALGERREAWKRAHAPSEPFPGFVVTRIPAKTELRVVRLLVNSAVLAGYPHAFHVVRTGDGSREAAVQLDPAFPTSGKAPARLLVRLVPKEIMLLWYDPNAGDLWKGALSRDALRPSTPAADAPAQLVDRPRDAWAKAPPDAHEWMLSASNACAPTRRRRHRILVPRASANMRHQRSHPCLAARGELAMRSRCACPTGARCSRAAYRG